MYAARRPRSFNGICGTGSERGHLSCHCLLRRDCIYPDVPTLSSPPQINRSDRGGTGYDLPVSPPSYSGRSGSTGFDIPRSPPQYSRSNDGYGTNGGPQQQYGRGADGSAGYRARFAQQQQGPRPFCSFGWEQRGACSGSHILSCETVRTTLQLGGGTALWPQQQQDPRPFCSFGWEQRGACRNGPPMNGGLANSIAYG